MYVNIYIYIYIIYYMYIIRQTIKKTPDFTLHCVSCLIENLSDVILFFSNSFL